MEQLSGGGREAAWMLDFQRKYLSHLAAVLRRRKIECVTSVLVRSEAVKLAADLSLAMTVKGRSKWSRAILAKNIFRLKKIRCQSLFTVRSHRIRRSASDKSKPCKTTTVSKKFGRRQLRKGSRTGHNFKEEAGSTMASRMQTLRSLVPGGSGLETPVLLKEATDYIVALKMQVQALQAITDCHSYSKALPISPGPECKRI